MQTFEIKVKDSNADKILWLLQSLKDDVKIKKIPTQEQEAEKIAASVKQGLSEAYEAKAGKEKLSDAWDLADEL